MNERRAVRAVCVAEGVWKPLRLAFCALLARISPHFDAQKGLAEGCFSVPNTVSKNLCTVRAAWMIWDTERYELSTSCGATGPWRWGREINRIGETQ